MTSYVVVGQREWEAGVAAVGRRLLSHVCRPMNQSRVEGIEGGVDGQTCPRRSCSKYDLNHRSVGSRDRCQCQCQFVEEREKS